MIKIIIKGLMNINSQKLATLQFAGQIETQL